MVAIDTERVRNAAAGLRQLSAEPRELAVAMRTDAIEGVLLDESTPTMYLFGEIEREIRLLSEVYDARADLAVGADSFPSYEAYLAFQQAAIDRLGAAAIELGSSLTNGIGDDGTPFDFFGDLSDEAARELFEFLDAVGDEFADDLSKLLEAGKIVASAIPELLFVLRFLKLIRGKLPVITNGLLFKLLLEVVPRGSTIVHLVTQLSRFVRVAGGTAALIAFLAKGWDVAKQGWPWDAFEESGHDYIADLGELGFYGTLAVLLYFPGTIKVTGPLAAAFAIVWGTARYWEEITAPGRIVINEIAERTGEAWDDAVDFGGDVWDVTGGRAGDVFDDVTDWATDRIDDARDFGDDVIDFTEDRVDDVRDFGEDVVDTVGETVDGVTDRVTDIFEPDLTGTLVPSGPPQ